jgi:signal transduction histidine kinase
MSALGQCGGTGMNVSYRRLFCVAALGAAISLFGASSIAAAGATKDEAVAMVKKAVAFIRTEGPSDAYPEISDPSGRFVDRDLYIVVYGLDGMVLAHGADADRVGTNQIADKDPDGKAFVQERVELAAAHPSFWQTYKFMNPVTHQVEPKDMYCERLDETVVCGGVYQP